MSDLKKGFVKLNPVRGWLFDVYPSGPDEITIWFITENGERVRFVDRFIFRIYVAGNLFDLNRLAEKAKSNNLVTDCRLVEKNADFMEGHKHKVLEVSVKDYTKVSYLATDLFKFGNNGSLRFYNVDVTVPQAYLYDKDVFPFAHVMIVASGKRLCYDLLDSVESVDYSLPKLRSLWLKVSVKKEGVSQKLTDKIDRLSLEHDGKITVIDGDNEETKILELVKAFKNLDPDMVFTEGGDSFSLPYLAHRAFVNGVLDRFILSREDIPLKSIKGKGTTFFSYGRVYHKAPMQRLFGRVHIDVNNTFIYSACGLEGLIEVSRTCRVPIHRSSRASIGTIMSSLQRALR